ncbi:MULTISPECIES: hypothetical protein [Bacillales]|nr:MULTISPECIES: hypothetical protein [Bacillaceae]PFG13791.1 hypothetical protein ATG70_2007 [Bacillus sp. es.036]
MIGKPIHFDGSSSISSAPSEKKLPFKLTDEVRKNLSGNPYQLPKS